MPKCSAIMQPIDPAPPDIFSPRPVLVSEQAFRSWLAALSARHTGKRVAQAAGISPSQLSSIIHGRGSLGSGLAARFGYSRELSMVYRPVEEQPSAISYQLSAEKPEVTQQPSAISYQLSAEKPEEQL